ncbi:ROK family protein [Faecalibaculum rodentium]|jgi:glucokinase|uniref:ROK family protein n=1 Tax=Faecalibaculum rodentium TaxID=1702221 RepID=UPI0023F54F07|nr:ROK family protein [Faecalibaculum rodentium]
MKYAVGVDIGGTNSRIALVDENMNIVERTQFRTDAHDPIPTIVRLSEALKDMAGDKELVGMGVSCPGPLDLINGKVLNTPNLHDSWQDFPIAGEIEKVTDIPTYLENDANLAALAEAVVGEGRDYNYVQFLTISTGLGSGQVINHKIYQGAHGYGHEVAYAPLWRNGPQHGKIYPGGVEAICSGTAITERAKKAGLDVQHAGEVNDMARQGNEAAMEIMDDAKEYLANFIAILIAITDPEIVILGGSVALKIPGFVQEVEDRVKEKVLTELKPYVKVRPSTLNEDSGLLGAACLAFEHAKDKEAA